MVAVIALPLDAMAIRMSWIGMKYPEMIIELDNFDHHDASGRPIRRRHRQARRDHHALLSGR